MRSFLSAFIAALALVTAAAPALAAQGRTTTNLPLRAAPASNTELLLTMPAGSTVTVGSCSGAWCRVTWNSYSGYTRKSGLVISAATRTRGPVRGGVTTADGSQLWPILPPYPYRSGYYPKADWYHDIPPYVAIEPSFYRRRYFMILQEHDRYRFMPHVFSGDRYGGGSIQDIDMQKISATLKSDESTSTYTRPDTTIPNPTNPAFWIKNQRSLFVSRTRPGTLRRKTINCCRSATFSASSRLFDLNGEAKTARTKQSSANIVH